MIPLPCPFIDPLNPPILHPASGTWNLPCCISQPLIPGITHLVFGTWNIPCCIWQPLIPGITSQVLGPWNHLFYHSFTVVPGLSCCTIYFCCRYKLQQPPLVTVVPGLPWKFGILHVLIPSLGLQVPWITWFQFWSLESLCCIFNLTRKSPE